MEPITIADKTYRYAFDFKGNPDLRSAFNALTKATFGFSFEQWYLDGLWSYAYIPYTLFDGEKAVSSVSVYMQDFLVLGEKRKFVQIGTVMSDPAYRNKGLSRFLMETVMTEWRDNCDLIFLFANDEVADFYPKFGFAAAGEYQHSKTINSQNTAPAATQLNLSNEMDKAILLSCSNASLPISKIAMLDAESLVMFYLFYYMQNNIYYIENRSAVVIAEYIDDALHINDIFCARQINIDDIISAMATKQTKKVVLGFTPNDTSTFDCAPLIKENTTLFIEKDKLALLSGAKFMFPVLSHT